MSYIYVEVPNLLKVMEENIDQCTSWEGGIDHNMVQQRQPNEHNWWIFNSIENCLGFNNPRGIG